MNRRALVFVGAASALDAQIHSAAAQNAESGLALMERFAATLTAHDIVGFAALLADDYKNHQVSAAAPGPLPGITPKQATVNFFNARLTGIPDMKVTMEVVVATADKVGASFVYTGTHGGVYFGVAPTGKALRFTSCDIYSVRDGALVEHWGMGDIAGVLAQLKG